MESTWLERMIKVAIMQYSFIWTSSTGAKLGPNKVHEQRISLKERPAACSSGNPKTRINEIMSDHSLSS